MIIFLHVLFAGIGHVVSNPTVYDQRQSGKTNVRVEVKDAVIIAVGDGELGGDYDYSYDYSDLTIKPSHQPPSTSSAPLPSTLPSVLASTSTSASASTSVSASASSTSKPILSSTASASTPSLVQNAAVVLEAENNSIIFPPNKPGNESAVPNKISIPAYKPDQIPVLVLQDVHGSRPNKFLPVKTVEKHYVSSSRIRGKVPGAVTINPEALPARHCSPGFFLDNHNRCKRIRRPSRQGSS